MKADQINRLFYLKERVQLELWEESTKKSSQEEREELYLSDWWTRKTRQWIRCEQAAKKMLRAYLTNAGIKKKYLNGLLTL